MLIGPVVVAVVRTEVAAVGSTTIMITIAVWVTIDTTIDVSASIRATLAIVVASTAVRQVVDVAGDNITHYRSDNTTSSCINNFIRQQR